MREIIFHDGTFAVVMVLGIAGLAFLIYIAIKMSKKQKHNKQAKNKMILSSVLAGVLGLILSWVMFDHFKHRSKHAHFHVRHY